MKMQPATFRALRAVILSEFTPQALRNVASAHKAYGLSAERFRWDVLHASTFDSNRLYNEGLNDSHIDTALRQILTYYTGDLP